VNRRTVVLLVIVLAFVLWLVFRDTSLPFDPGDCDPHERVC
jgi:hypothetical protein